MFNEGQVLERPVKKDTVYISGQMGGLPNYNYPAFFQAEEDLKAKGYEVVNPANIGVRDDEGFTWSDYMREALIKMLDRKVTVIGLLDGWENSKGATMEKELAEQLGIQCISIHDLS